MLLGKPPAPLSSWSQVRAHLAPPINTCMHSSGICDTASCFSPPAETAPPSFVQRLQSTTVSQGSQVRLDIRVTGIPTPLVKFYREGAEIQSSADFRILQEGDLHSLLIAEAFPEDSGMYSVTATSSSGRATCSAELLVQGEPLRDQFFF